MLTTEATQNLSQSAQKNIYTWLTNDMYQEYRDELQQMLDEQRWKELEDAFFTVIEFGTGGRRGATGVGSNRINRVTIGQSAQALCEYAQSVDERASEKGVVIACDTRLTSPELSRYAAQVCAANGFKVYIFDSFRATPELSFAVRDLQAAIGIVISASHNPPQDNGFKAYWSDGGQIVAPHDAAIMTQVEGVTSIHTCDFDESVQKGQIEIIGAALDERYIQAVVGQAEGELHDVSIVYSPLHGAGQTNVLPALRAAGFNTICLVEEQMNPDGYFPTVPNGKPNPEEKAANDLAVKLLIEQKADIAITNDPDADRIGVIVRHEGQPVYLNGNQSAVLATDYALKQKQTRGDLGSQHYIAKTIVTTDMLDGLAAHYGVTCYGNMLVGFKYIGNLILRKESTDEIFVIGGEESYGLLKGDYARDKDGAVGALLLAEYAAELKAAGRTLYDRLLELYEKHGIFSERLDTVVCPGADGFTRMQRMMDYLRTTPPTQLGPYAITHMRDYKTSERTDITTGTKEHLDVDTGNVIVLELGDIRRRITVRPSGTEPKIKLYVQWFEDDVANTEEQIDVVQKLLRSLSAELEVQLLAATE